MSGPRFGTRLVHYPAAPGDPLQPLATPIYQTATFAQPEADRFGPYDYSRSGNPTRTVLETQLAALEGGLRAFAYGSGMAAITAVTRLLSAGDSILADFDLYGGTSRLFHRVLPRAGISVQYADATDLDALARALTPSTRLLYVETPTNPLLRILPLRALADFARAHGILLCVDSSAVSPYLQQPLALGAHLVVQSATKFLGGHSDLSAGAVITADPTLADQLAFHQNAEGTALAPFESFLLLRGLKTLKLRLDAQQTNARALFDLLATHPAVTRIHYPGSPAHPGHALHAAQASGPGSLLSIELPTPAAAKRLAESLQLFTIAVSFGSVTSTCCIPAAMSHASVPAEHAAHRTIPPTLLRLSPGIEDPADLQADLTTALATL